MDCGHFIKRRYLNTRWDLANLRPQCPYCNRDLGGNYKIYTEKMMKQLGEDAYSQLWNKAYSNHKMTTPELEQLLTEMQKKLKALEIIKH